MHCDLQWGCKSFSLNCRFALYLQLKPLLSKAVLSMVRPFLPLTQNVTEVDDNGSKPYSCWGHFRAFCKGHGEKGCGAAGFKCDGHWVGFKVLILFSCSILAGKHQCTFRCSLS